MLRGGSVRDSEVRVQNASPRQAFREVYMTRRCRCDAAIFFEALPPWQRAVCQPHCRTFRDYFAAIPPPNSDILLFVRPRAARHFAFSSSPRLLPPADATGRFTLFSRRRRSPFAHASDIYRQRLPDDRLLLSPARLFAVYLSPAVAIAHNTYHAF